MGRRASAALALVWKRRIARQRRSRLSVAEFCSQEGVSPKSFYVWRRRLHVDQPRAARHVDQPRAAMRRRRLHEVPLRAAQARSGARRTTSRLFVPVELPASAPVGVRIELPGGAVVILPADISAGLLRAAIRAVLSDAHQERSSC